MTVAFRTLISIEELSTHLEDPSFVIVDCRFSLSDTEKGRCEYLLGHIPGAVYCHLEDDLCGPIIKGATGRHPLPDPSQAATRLSQLGIGSDTQVVAYDDWPGAPGTVAARLWWTLRWLGHESAAVLNGGLPAWQAAGLALRSGIETRHPRDFRTRLRPELAVGTEEVQRHIHHPGPLLFDSRSPDRFRGENETIDPVAGHIPGAASAFYLDNLDAAGYFLPVEILRERFKQLFGDIAPEHSAFYCGSGVSAIVNILAIQHAGLGEARLYAGSWSEWITDPGRPVTKGG